ncbi:serine-type D-Ala-D-Ala carboxypeptidase [Vespertiliibacter pulmonis]|uniref:D-alanyl-D-alanine carboxypeptidase/D-alanyl-D-alanine-endopeptidase (Penicillin-binding protein 4) n=1 Tax=Vespertiliibacter pulmonis TaxID=1443036 RepID=A0A3N4VWQ1_9PAST|nr:serine-type D-Ala-D-Ala carboxypeptidase [Vespertiliibacter pulmonis]QLB21438.1 serine-type D-Ala-D-Ala carboxypeptidase [Vespertiliibacter pulmonis]RPE85853.1 D-alanyl-D-alanine carboxypeptidase/D-alanyl-D-alanine-endopeptidase (penicillin-binding protein 4) [Vespertiliibacter pulmonis]
MFSFRHIFSKTLLIFLVSFPLSTGAKVAVSELLSSLPAGVSVSVIAKNLETGQIIAEHQSQAFMLPASTQKVFTALATKLALPDDFRFQTAFLSKGNIENGTLKGDLIAKFTGDPTLSHIQLTKLVEELGKQGIRQITGNLILDTSVFTSHNKASGWIWNDLSLCFSAQPAAVNIDHNCFYANLEASQPAGSPVTVNVPAEYPVQVFSSAYVAENADVPYCLLDAVVSDNNRYHIKGCLARQDKPFGLSFAVQDPTAYGASMIQAKLKHSGIKFSGQVQVATKPQTGLLLAEHYSVPLSDLVKKMMKKSDNQIADTLFRTIANQKYKRSASFPLASQALRDILKKQANIDLANGVIVDGSGLSRHNLVNAQTMLDALVFIAKNEEQLHLFETFPIAGVDGTLSGRGSVITAPLANNLIAKTGALKGVYNLAGFMSNVRGERIAFVEFINGYSTSQNIESKTKRAPLNQFENALFMNLYNE